MILLSITIEIAADVMVASREYVVFESIMRHRLHFF